MIEINVATIIMNIVLLVFAGIGTVLLLWSRKQIDDIVQEKDNKVYRFVRKLLLTAIVVIWILVAYNYVYLIAEVIKWIIQSL